LPEEFKDLVTAYPEEPIEQWMEFCKYVTDGRTRTFQKVANYFGKNIRTIAAHAKKFNWATRVREYERAQIGSIFAEDRETVLLVQKAMMGRIRFIMDTDIERQQLLRVMRERKLTDEEQEKVDRLNLVMLQTDYKALNELIKEAFAIDQGMKPQMPGIPEPAPGPGFGKGGVVFNLIIGKGTQGSTNIKGQLLVDKKEEGAIDYKVPLFTEPEEEVYVCKIGEAEGGDGDRGASSVETLQEEPGDEKDVEEGAPRLRFDEGPEEEKIRGWDGTNAYSPTVRAARAK
jgi:hypothetical protein